MDLFGTAGIRGPVESVITPSMAVTVGQAAASDGDQWVVGWDGRTTGPALANAVCAGLASGGATVERVGMIPTPILAFASQNRRGIMVTASHNPPSDNGVKFFVDGVEYDSAAEERLENRIGDAPGPSTWTKWTADRRASTHREGYRETVLGYARRVGSDPTGMSVAIDCGAGVAGPVTPSLLSSMGADVTAINAHVDGHFTARPSEPTKESLATFSAYLAKTPSMALGFAHDGDGDRLMVLDGNGNFIHPDTVNAIFAEYAVTHTDVDDPVVLTTPNASSRIDSVVKEAGGRMERVGLGSLHEGIAEIEGATGDGTQVVFAAEPGKHIHPPVGNWIDAIASAAIFLRIVADAGSIDQLREPIPEPPTARVNLDCPEESKSAAMAVVRDHLPDHFPTATIDRSDGLRLEWDDGTWILVRPSGTEPIVRLYGEGPALEDRFDQATHIVEDAIEWGTSDG